MRTSVLIALLAVSFTAVLAAPQHKQVSVHKIHVSNLKQLALPKIAIAPKSPIGDLIELIGLIIGIDVNAVIEQAGLTISEVEAALNEAALELVDLSARVDEQLAQELEAVINAAVEEALVIAQPLLDIINKLIPGAASKRNLIVPNSLIDELLKLLIGLTVDELVALVENTVTELEALAGRTLAAIDDIALRLSAELQAETDRIIAEAEARIVAAVQPLLDLLKPILPPAKTNAVEPRIDLPELIALIAQALAQIDAALAKADAALLELLTSSTLLDEINAVLEQADRDVLAAIEAAVARALVTPVGELPQLVAATVEAVQAIVNNAVAAVQVIIADETPELVSQIRAISLELITEIQDALIPLIEAVSPPESKAVALPKSRQLPGLRVTLPELIALISVAIRDVATAVETASSALEAILIGTTIIEDVLQLVSAAETDALKLIEAAVAEALQTPVGELPALIERLTTDLQTLLAEAAAEIQALVGREAQELAAQVEAVVAQLVADVTAAIQPIVDALNPPESH